MHKAARAVLLMSAGFAAGCGGGDNGNGYCVGSFEGGGTNFSCTTCSGVDGTKSNEFAAAIDNNSETFQGFSFGNSGGTITIRVNAPAGQSFPGGANSGALVQFPSGIALTASYSLYNNSTPVAATSGSTIASGAPPSGAGSTTFYPVVPSGTINRIDLAISVPANASGAAFKLNEVCGDR